MCSLSYCVTSSISFDILTPYSMDWSKIKVISGVLRRLIFFASCLRIYPSALFNPFIVSSWDSLSPRTLIYALQVFKSGATSTDTTEVIGFIRGSLISPLIMLLSSFNTSPLILVFFTLFLRILKTLCPF